MTASPEIMVLDTSVLVSALINSFRAPGRVLELALIGEIVVAHDDRILSEWRDILSSEKLGFTRGDVETLLEFFEHEGLAINAPPLGAKLPNPDDAPFLEVAHAAAAILVTGNLNHYPLEERRGTEVTEPAALLEKKTSEVGREKRTEGGNDG